MKSQWSSWIAFVRSGNKMRNLEMDIKEETLMTSDKSISHQTVKLHVHSSSSVQKEDGVIILGQQWDKQIVAVGRQDKIFFSVTVSTPSFSQPFCADCLKRTLDRILKLTSDWHRSTQWEMTCTDAVSAAESKIRALQNRTLLVMSSPLGRLSGAHQPLSPTSGTVPLFLSAMCLCLSLWEVSL